MSAPLSAPFLAALGDPAPSPEAGLEAALQRRVEAARASLPGASLPEADFVRHLARGVRPGAALVEAVEGLHAEDLWLALAAARGQAAALQALDRCVVAAVRPALAHLRLPEGAVEEVEQRLRQKLLVPTAGRPARVLDYLGRGALLQWLKAGAVREALNLLEQQRPGTLATESVLEEVPAGGEDPELAAVRQRYAPEFKAAFQAALTGLPPAERNYLRLYFVQGLTVEEIGRMQGTHKSTVSRWMARTRATLLEEVRRRLQQRLKLAPSEFDSLMGVLQSQLDLSLHRVLAPEED